LEVWGLGVYLPSIRLLWESDYGGMLWREAFLRWIVNKKYGSLAGDWCTNVVNGPYRVSFWKTNRRVSDAFSSFVSIEVGDNSRTRFWDEVWCGDHSLNGTFPELF
jgi:hypothetical protein